MALSHKLELRQSQQLVMTPQLMQAIKLLQLSNLDLIAYVDAELERNPLLERADSDDGPAEPPAEAGAERSQDKDDGSDPAEDGSEWLETRLEADPEAIEAKLDTDLANVFPDDHGRGQDAPAPTLPGETWSAAPTRQPVSSDDYNLEA